MNKLSEAIEQAKQDCLSTGNGEIKIDNITIYADWVEYEKEYGFDVIEITIFENGISKLIYQLEETKTKQY